MTDVAIDTLADDPQLLKQVLRRVVQEQAAAVQERDAALVRAAQAESERDALRHQLALKLRSLYGRSSEKIDPKQLELFVTRVERIVHESADEDGSVTVPGHARRKAGRTPLASHLPREEVVHDVSEEERRCPCCNLPRPEVHRHVREVIEITPAQVKVVRHVRPVYLCVCSPERGPVSAPAPRLPLGKARAGAGVLALIAVSKFADHAPLYRQEGMLARSGLDLSRTTMCGWLTSGAELIEPLLKLMRRCVLASKVIQTDDTPVPTLGLIIGRTKQARMWS